MSGSASDALSCRRVTGRFVDDWADTGSTALVTQQLVQDAGAQWAGAVVLVDALSDSRLRRALGLRALLHLRELPEVPPR